MKLEFNQVVKKYDGFMLDCTMTVEEGCVTGLIGRNGAGKSTAFKAALGLIRLDGGTVTLDGKDVASLAAKEKEKIGVVLSDSGFSSYLAVKDVVCIMKGMYKNFRKEEFLERCKRFGLPLDKQIKEFSTGMKAKLKVLVAMSYGAKLLILDEPTAGLDPVGREEILGELKELNEVQGITIVLVSHSMEDVARYAKRMIVMNHGKVLFDGTPREVFSHRSEMEEIGLGVPQVTRVMESLEKSGVPVKTGAITVDEAEAEIARVFALN